jgi:hypothetical protein
VPLSTTSPRRLLAADRRARAVALRREGRTIAEVARLLDVSTTMTRKYLLSAIDELNATCLDDVEALRALELERLEVLHRTWWPRALGLNGNRPNGRAARVVLTALDRRMRCSASTTTRAALAPRT